MNPGRKYLSRLLMLFLCLSLKIVTAQRIYMNSPGTLYEVNGGIGNCNYTAIPVCQAIENEGLYSIAYHKGTIFILTRLNNLFAVDVSNPGNCSYLTAFPGMPTEITSMTVDKKGVLWAIRAVSLDLFSFDPSNATFRDYGKVPHSPSGDLIFYNDKLLYAANNATIIEINLQNPAASVPFMGTQPYSFYGVIAFPDQCNRNKLYGIASGQNLLIELDMENRTVIGPRCQVPSGIYDAGSEVEDGNTVGVTINSLNIKVPCLPTENTGDVQINASTAGIGVLTYTLDNTSTNNTGNFPGVALGQHTIRISNSLGCFSDTSFVISIGVHSLVNIDLIHPSGCGPDDGSITAAATSPYALSYRLNNGPPQSGNTFTGLGAGNYFLRITDAGGCSVDTAMMLKVREAPAYIRDIETVNTICTGKTGSIKINAPAGTLTSLNNGAYTAINGYTQLDEGSYVFSVRYNGVCTFDTMIRIDRTMEPDPVINITKKDQLCEGNNGFIELTVTGPGDPYSSSINNGAFTTDHRFESLRPGSQALVIQSAHKCEWRTTAEILAYVKEPFNNSISIKQPGCEVLTDGALTVQASGTQSPYYISLNGTAYHVNTINNLTAGDYELKWYNADHCVLKTEQVKLVNTYTPVCDNVFLPSAFTPNGDGLNDVFKPVLGSPVTTGNTLTIYNRHGQIIFQNNNGRGWNGTFRNVRQDSGVYVWIYTYRDFHGSMKQQKGTVTLIR